VSDVAVMPRRSCLVLPAHAARMHAKARASAADEVVFDLEDAVAGDAKPAARAQLTATLSEPEWAGRAIAIRVNAPGSADLPVDLALWAQLAPLRPSLVIPKVQGSADVEQVVAEVGDDVAIQALIETPEGIAVAAEVARHASVVALILGYADLAAALGRRGAEEDPGSWLVQQEALIAAARIGGAQAIDGPFFGIRDQRGVAGAARRARALGFDGKWAIHPDQVAPLNAAFAPSPREQRWAHEVREAVAQAGRSGGAAAQLGGAMVDDAMVRRADRLLALPAAEPAAARPAPARVVGAPYFEDLAVGDVFGAPGITISAGHAALHQAVIGDRLRLALDAPLYEAVSGQAGLLAHPMLVCDLAIGQSTTPSARVLGNLFYRGLGSRPVTVGSTLRTQTEVVARRAASRGRGVVALRVTTIDQQGAPVLDFWRCPLLPARGDEEGEQPADDLDAVGQPVDVHALVPDWDLAPLREHPLGTLFAELQAGETYAVEAAETVTSAPELARLSLNVAMTHTDAASGAHGERLVYGGHVIGVAAAHLVRAFPDLATILAWESCDHLGPTFEGDRLTTTLELLALEALSDGGLLRVRAQVAAHGADDDDPRDVLDWTLVALMP
jgi:citrate lyase beta subunit/acyl dehydratase